MTTLASLATEYNLHPDEVRGFAEDKDVEPTEPLGDEAEERIRYLLDHPDAC